MVPVNINLPTIQKGDTWEGLTIGPILFNGAPPTTTLVSCKLYFRNRQTKQSVYKLGSTGLTGMDGAIVILDAINWKVTAPKQVINIAAAQYDWDFETVDSAGVVRTLYEGIVTIKQDVTYD